MGINLRIGFVHGYAAACESKRMRIETLERGMIGAEKIWSQVDAGYKHKLEAERARSAKLLHDLSWLALDNEDRTKFGVLESLKGYIEEYKKI